jgi:hypothetical protein
VVEAYWQVARDYDAARQRIERQGHEAVTQFLAAKAGPLHAKFTAELKAAVTKEQLRALPRLLQGDTVHFERRHPLYTSFYPKLGGIFDGFLTGDVIEGAYAESTYFNFYLIRTSPPVPGAPLDGRWEGEVLPGFLVPAPIGIIVTFETIQRQLRATIDIPSRDIEGERLRNVRYRPKTEIGQRTSSRAVPFSPDVGIWNEYRVWEQAEMLMQFIFNARGTIPSLGFAPDWGLPPDPAKGRKVKTIARVPFDGVWWMAHGGEARTGDIHAIGLNSRHAHDMAIWKNGGTFHGAGTKNEDYWAWDQPVRVPADGTVVYVRAQDPDNNPGEIPGPDAFGNEVAIRTAPDELLDLVHFRQNSIQVRKGERVRTGQLLGQVGSSGISLQPHIHIQLQTGEKPFDFEKFDYGLPLAFSNFFADGRPVRRGVPLTGTFVQHDSRHDDPTRQDEPAAPLAPGPRQRDDEPGRGALVDAMRLAVGPINGYPLSPQPTVIERYRRSLRGR